VEAEDADVETSSDAYALRFAGPVGQWFLDVQAGATLDLLAPWPRARVLDVGGGHGQLTGPLVEAGFDVTVYGSAVACGARVRPWTEPGRARFQSGPLLHAPFPDRAFDVVLAYRLLPHVAHWRELVAELARLAGRAVLVDHPTKRSMNAVSTAFFGLKKGVEGDTRPFTVFADVDVTGAFAESGLRATGRRPQFFFPMALHRAVGVAPVARGLEAAAAAWGLTRAFGSPVILRVEREG
jgi:SAM-dependent methyltransferase